MRGFVALLLLGVLFAGCSGSPDSVAPSAASAAAIAAKGLTAPLLAVGDWWNFTSPVGSFNYVVSADTGDDYTMDTDGRSLAFFNAQNDVSTLGPVRKSDLAGSQGGTRVQFFDWPLLNNKTWSMTLDKNDLKVTAKRVNADEYQMTARLANGTAYVAYRYDNRTRFFKEIDFAPGSANGFKIIQQRHGKAFAGDLMRWTYDTVINVAGDLTTITPGFVSYNVPLSATDIYADVELHCASGFAAAGTTPFPFVGSATGTDNRGAGDGGPCPMDISFHGVAGAVGPATATGNAETWGRFLVGGPGTVGTYALAIYVRTAIHFKAGSAP